MTAYVIGIRDSMSDAAAYEAYKNVAMETLGEREHSFLAFDGRHRTLEGADAEGAFILTFPTYEEADAWLSDPRYQDVVPIRKSAATHRIILIDGL